ncbi:peptidase U32 family protein [Mucilaginibacter sp.]|uniref:peptidase U32 family protein n=1 Tax=Mucilaginibacter sp. TaxID=1882438 RepID=UPI00284C2B67|nr:peptidase U32 family protein [Mucilaginibacter sp.]MDR3693908.1 U32 family peptidase [Mucilaginibacter sp.]
MKKNKIELLSPAGSFDCLQAAINAGADAVYFGVEQLNMRAKSVNSFGVDDIEYVAAICSVNNVRAYLTLNTIIYGHDLQLLRGILNEVKKHCIDAVIASDFAVIEQCSQMGIPLHISTQANVSNIEAVQFFARFSDVIVLARELTLKQVQDICKEVKRRDIKGVSGGLIKIEVFIHGALCMAVSGKCYLSLHTQNASANRGACTQNCRRSYLVKDAETKEELLIDNEYIMSPKDLCTIGVLDQIIRCGVDVLKIEGRSKGADYVHVTTQCYREALQAIENNNYTSEKIGGWLNRLSTVYNRGFWEGYYLGHKLGEWTSQPGSSATEKKIYVGKGSNYYPNIGVAEFTIETGTVRPGDTLMITGPLCGMVKEKAGKLFINGAEGLEAVKGDKITFPFGVKVGSQDKLYKIVEAVNG